MNKWITKFGITILTVAILFSITITAQAKGEDTIKKGIFISGIDVGGMTEEEATQAVLEYVEALEPVEITLVAANQNEVVTTAGELGITWNNPEVIKDALGVGKQGNVITRYKVMKDLLHENIEYEVALSFDIELINTILNEKCTRFNQNAVNVSLKRENGVFQVVDGVQGSILDIETSIDVIYDFLTTEWNHEATNIPLEISVEEPKGNADELAKVTDVLGSFTTSFSSSSQSRSSNVINGCELIDGTTLYPGEEFSTYQSVAPFSEANGYYMAGSYLNGKVVDSLGGGICQVSTTLYNTVLNAELEVSERHNHSMIVSYVDPSADAAIAESSGKDFRFVNNTDSPIYIEGIISNRKITFNIYGHETRSADRKVTYESEVLEVINPTSDTIYADNSQPIGYIVKESAHIGYKAKLWKVVTENGVEVSRTQVNSSSYKMVPRSATVGTATADPNAHNEIMAAIGTNSIDHVNNVIAILTAPPAIPEETPTE